MSTNRNLFTSTLTSSLRGWAGINSNPASHKPKKLLELYDLENCPFCRLVREALTELDLDALIYPCPKGGTRYRPLVEEKGGKAQFPFLVDPNTNVEMYESLDIINYLYETYGQRQLPIKWRVGILQKISSMVASVPRVLASRRSNGSGNIEKPLELYSFEASPFARPVRELLSKLELPYVLRSCGRNRLDEWLLPPVRDMLGVIPQSELENRRNLIVKEGRVSIPYLYDPNTEYGLFESERIMEYLDDVYGV